jgi:hypothetical protein
MSRFRHYHGARSREAMASALNGCISLIECHQALESMGEIVTSLLISKDLKTTAGSESGVTRIATMPIWTGLALRL